MNINLLSIKSLRNVVITPSILTLDLSSTTEFCDNKNASGYCKGSYEWACVDPLYPWFKVDCKKLCKQCYVSSACTDDNKWGICRKGHWACNGHAWYKQDCAKSCNVC